MIRNLLLFLIIGLIPLITMAQQVPQYSLYHLNPYAYNPAYLGASSQIEANGVFRKQWTGLEGSPTTQNLNVVLPISYLSSGIGMNIENDMIGALRLTRLSLGYAYGLEIGKESKLSFGVNGGVLQSSLDGSRLLAPDGEYGGAVPIHNDNLLPETRINAISYSIDAGIYFKTSTLDAGISVMHLTESKVDYSFNDVTDFNFSRHYVGYLAYNFELNGKFSIRPSVLAKTDLIQSQLDVAVSAHYDQRYLAGLSFRGYNSNTIDALGVFGGLKIARNWMLAYQYDFPLSDLNTVNQGSHEVMLKYELKKTIGKGRLPKIIHNPRLL